MPLVPPADRVGVGVEVEAGRVEHLLHQRVPRVRAQAPRGATRPRAAGPTRAGGARPRRSGGPSSASSCTHLVVAVVGEAVAVDGEAGEAHRRDAADEIFHRQRRRRELPLAVAPAHATRAPPQRLRVQVALLDEVVARQPLDGAVLGEVDDRAAGTPSPASAACARTRRRTRRRNATASPALRVGHRRGRRLVEHADDQHGREDRREHEARPGPAVPADHHAEPVEEAREHRDRSRTRRRSRSGSTRARPARPTSSSGRLNPPLVREQQRGNDDDPEPRFERPAASRSARRSERTSTVVIAHHQADRADEPELRGAETFAARFVQTVRQRGERTEPVLRHGTQQLDEPERVRLGHARAPGRARRAGSVAWCQRKSSVGRLARNDVASPTAPNSAAISSRPGRRRASALDARADRDQREEEREVVDAGHADEHGAEQQPPHAPPRGAVAQLGHARATPSQDRAPSRTTARSPARRRRTRGSRARRRCGSGTARARRAPRRPATSPTSSAAIAAPGTRRAR